MSDYVAPPGLRAADRSRGRGRRAVVLLLVIAAAAAVIWLAVFLAHRAAPATGPGGPRGRPSTTVGVAIASLSDIPITIEGLGTVTPAATVTVSPQVSGVITQILFREGQMVQRGQAIAVIDPRPLQQALNQAQGALARDQAQLENARLLLQRDQTLLAQDSIARQDVDTQAALVRQLQGTVVADQAQVGTARLNLGFSRVIAPVGGRVGLRTVDVGNYIASGSTTGLAVITEITPIDVEFTIPQDDVPRLQQQASLGSLPVTVFDRTRTVQLDSGVFSTLDNRIDTTTGTVRAKARFPNGRGTLFPNQFVNVKLGLESLHNVVVVPVTAMRTGAAGDFVWVVEGHTARLRKVTRGPATATVIAVTQGLQAGEKVVTEGGDRLTDGARLTLPGDAPAAGGRAGGRGGRGGAGGAAGAGRAGRAGGSAAPATPATPGAPATRGANGSAPAGKV
jgi:multidrug efflux system membrane fusion protein